MVYEYIKTAFGVFTGILDTNKLLIVALVAMLLYCLWVTLSLIFSFERRFDRNAKNINDAIVGKGITADNFYGVNKLINKMPNGFVRGWNTFRYKKRGLPSEFIKREDSLDLELLGGVFNRNRSLMKTLIYSVFVFLFVMSIAILGDVQLTGYLIAECALIPLIFLALARTTYYIYTAIRQNQYRNAVESFNELLKTLDACVVSSQENKGVANYKEEKEEMPTIVSVDTEDSLEIKEQSASSNNEESVEHEEKVEVKTEDKPAPKKRGRPRLEFPAGETVVIKTDKEFEAALERAEKLMRKSEQELSPAQAKRVEKSLKELIDAMNKYREED